MELSLGKFQGLDDVWLGTSSLGLELIDLVDTFLGELNILASEMPVDCSFPIDRPPEIKIPRGTSSGMQMEASSSSARG
jgi:hypothetical protein